MTKTIEAAKPVSDRLLEALGSDENVRVLCESLALLDRRVCDGLVSGRDFTLKLTVRGDRGRLLQCTLDGPEILRPRGGDGEP